MDDLISRQAAIDFIDAGHFVNPNEPRWSDNEVVNFLKSRPSADVQPVRRGHWEKIGKPTWWGLYECSECHKTCSIDYTYCPHCGSIMKEKKND